MIRALQKIEAMHVRCYWAAMNAGNFTTSQKYRKYARQVRADIDKLPNVEHEIKGVICK